MIDELDEVMDDEEMLEDDEMLGELMDGLDDSEEEVEPAEL